MKNGLRIAALAALVGLAGCATPPAEQPRRVVSTGPVGDVTNAPVGAGVNVRPGSDEDFIVNVGRRIYFKQSSAELDDAAQETLNNQAAWLATYANYPIKVDGFSDDPGSAAENMRLGMRRAEAAKAYLVSRGIEPTRIRVRSSGNTRPTMRCPDITCKSQNRHVRTVLDPVTRGGLQPADVPLRGNPDAVNEEPVAAAPAAGTTVATASGATISISGRARAEAMVARR